MGDEETDIIDLSAGYDQIDEYYKDALVIIGRKSRVELCVFMIEMTLNHFRNITRTRNNVRKLRRKINEIKGNQGPPYGGYGRGRGRRGGRGGRGRGGNNYNDRNRQYQSRRRYNDEQYNDE